MNQLLSEQQSFSQSHQRQRAHGSPSHEAQVGISKEAIKAIYSADALDIQQVGALNLNLNDMYCETIIKQANRSFWSALIAASVALVFFIMASALLLSGKPDAGQLSLITSLGAALTAFVSGTSFYLYTHAMRHFEAFHVCLARTEIVLLENSVCKQIEDPTKRDAAYISIVENVEKLAVLVTSYGQKSQASGEKAHGTST